MGSTGARRRGIPAVACAAALLLVGCGAAGSAQERPAGAAAAGGSALPFTGSKDRAHQCSRLAHAPAGAAAAAEVSIPKRRHAVWCGTAR